MPPQIDVDREPVAVVANFFRIQHQRAIRAGADDVALQSRLGDDLAITVGQLLAQFVDVRIILAGEHAAECRQAGSHRNRIGVVSSAVKNFVLRNQVHHRFVRSERRQRQSAADRLSQANHVGPDVEVFRSPAPAKFRASFHFVENQQRAVVGRDLAQSFEEAGLRHAQADVHQNRLENDRGNFAGILFEAILDACEIVESGDLNIFES